MPVTKLDTLLAAALLEQIKEDVADYETVGDAIDAFLLDIVQSSKREVASYLDPEVVADIRIKANS